MKEYTSRQIAPKLYREDTGIALASKANLWRKGKRIGKGLNLFITISLFLKWTFMTNMI